MIFARYLLIGFKSNKLRPIYLYLHTHYIGKPPVKNLTWVAIGVDNIGISLLDNVGLRSERHAEIVGVGHVCRIGSVAPSGICWQFVAHRNKCALYFLNNIIEIICTLANPSTSAMYSTAVSPT